MDFIIDSKESPTAGSVHYSSVFGSMKQAAVLRKTKSSISSCTTFLTRHLLVAFDPRVADFGMQLSPEALDGTESYFLLRGFVNQ